VKHRTRLALLGIAILALLAAGATLAADRARPAPPPEPAPWDLRALSQPPAVEWLERTGKVHRLLYEAEPYKGRKTRVYALYASPLTLGNGGGEGNKYPAVVLVHGGGGHAFPQWAELYAKRGYAAIAMDLAGNIGEGSKATRLPDGGPPQDDQTKFRLADLPDKDQWTYHAVAGVILAHSLLRGFKEVDAERTGVVGISWGGYLVCLAAAVDGRFKAAVPMYGCGFLHENSAWAGSQFKYMSPEWTAKWVRLWDPSSYVGAAAMPMFFVNGSNDQYYPLDSYAKTYALVKAPKNIRIEINMPHGHRFDQKEILMFIDQCLKGEPPLPTVAPVSLAGDQIVAQVESRTKLVSAELHYTTGPHKENKGRPWVTRPLAVEGNQLKGEKPPAEATAWFVTVKDDRGAMVSSAPVVR